MEKSVVLGTIKSHIPTLPIIEATFDDSGQNSFVVFINNEYVFKFPRHEAAKQDLMREIKHLEMLKNLISFSVPEYQYNFLHSQISDQAFCGYLLMKGQKLSRDVYHNNRLAIVTQLDELLMQIHGIEKLKFAHLTSKQNFYETLYDQIKTYVFPHISTHARTQISENFDQFFKWHSANCYSSCIVHGDLGSSNIIYDEDAGHISGVIDWSSLKIGDPAEDLASLICTNSLSEECAEDLMTLNPQYIDMMERANFYISTFALQEALAGILYGDERAFLSGIKEYL